MADKYELDEQGKVILPPDIAKESLVAIRAIEELVVAGQRHSYKIGYGHGRLYGILIGVSLSITIALISIAMS